VSKLGSGGAVAGERRERIQIEAPLPLLDIRVTILEGGNFSPCHSSAAEGTDHGFKCHSVSKIA
jgi:hypothetical protein